MSDFWDGVEQIADANRAAMGEKVHIGGREMDGVPQPVEVDPAIVPGGISRGVTHQIEVSLADGDAVADGDVVECRVLKGRVVRKIHFGGGWLVLAGPENRAGGFEF